MAAPTFQKRLNLFDSIAIVVGSMIGSGIFIVSADIARTVGAPGWLMMVWLITGILTVMAALSYGELAGMMPQAGGQYVYLREAYNPMIGFLYGWSTFMVIQTGLIAAVAMAFAKFLGVLVPWFSEKNIWLDVGFLKLSTVHLAAIASILLLSWINSRGIGIGKYIQNIFTSTKVGVLLLFIVAGLIMVNNTGAIDLNVKIMWEAATYSQGNWIPLHGWALWAAVGTAMVGSVFASDAWNTLTFTSAEVINAKRNIPLGMAIGTAIVCCIYLLVNFIYLHALPVRGDLTNSVAVMQHGIANAVNDRVGTAAIASLVGGYAAIVMAVFVVISTFGCNNGLVLSGARVYYAMAEDGLFFKSVGKLNSNGVPANGLLYQCIWASLLCLSGTYSNLLDYVVMTVMLFYTVTIVGIFILRHKRPDIERPYKAFGYPVITTLYIIAASFIMVVLLIYKPMYTWPGLFIVLLGIPVYYVWKRQKS